MRHKTYFILPVVAIALSALLCLSTLDGKTRDLCSRTLKPLEESEKVLLVCIDDPSLKEIGTWPLPRNVYGKCLSVLKELGAGPAVFDITFFDSSSQADSDIEFADSLSFYGDSYLNMTFLEQNGAISRKNGFDSDKFALENVEALKNDRTPEKSFVHSCLPQFAQGCRSGGFVNIPIDKDGFRRNVDLFLKYQGDFYGQLVMVPLLETLGNPKVTLSRSMITLNDCQLPDGSVKTIEIPRCPDGSVLLKYPAKNFVSYNVISLWNIYRLYVLEHDLAQYIEIMFDLGYDQAWQGADIPKLYEKIQYVRTLPQDEFQGYADLVQEFYSQTQQFLSGENLKLLLEMADEEFHPEIEENFGICRENLDMLIASRKKMQARVQDAICVFGTNASDTTDYGVNLYQEHYPLFGLQSVIASQVLSQDFMTPVPFWISLVIVAFVNLIFSVLYFFTKGYKRKLFIGFISVLALTGVAVLYFNITQIYVDVLMVFASLTANLILSTVFNFAETSREKRFIQNALSQCLSKNIVKEIIRSPESFRLGGKRYYMTAMFSDIRNFSSICELLTPEQVVAFLNYYLTKMSDIIMEESGTVDKYEGDAIVSFFGAPKEFEGHASHACMAAVRIKKEEDSINSEIYGKVNNGNLLDSQLVSAFSVLRENRIRIFTRIGINSGYMLAGYMGSASKKNYTVMGNNVNIASRLEGVNKQYHTAGILVSGETRNLLGNAFVCKRLDRIQVINVRTPIRIYELLDSRKGTSLSLVKYVNSWDKAMDLFETKAYREALFKFQELQRINKNDKTVDYYIMLIEKFFLLGKTPEEKDDVGICYNRTNPQDMDPSWIGTEKEIRGSFRLLQK